MTSRPACTRAHDRATVAAVCVALVLLGTGGAPGLARAQTACLVDSVEADFASGTPAGALVSVTTNGEVILAPASGAEFCGTSLASGWTSVAWTGGTSTVAGGAATVDGARLTPVSTTGTGSGVVLEFVSTFAAAALQQAGLGSGDNTTGSSGMFGDTTQAWATFGTHDTGTELYVRIHNPANAAENEDVPLGASYLGAPHRYRIEWKTGPDSLVFLIDGASIERRATTIALSMRAGVSDFDTGGGTVVVDWIRRTPYAASGTFTSRVYDGGASSAWGVITWSSDTPAGTGLALSVRTGNSANPNASWTAFTPVASSGTAIGRTSRYIQYLAELTTSDPDATPVLDDVAIFKSPPTAVADLAAVRDTAGGAGGRIPVTVTFTLPGSADSVEVYRAPFGGYPDYDDGGGSVPATPSYPPPAPWVLTGVTASGQTDDPPSRDAWYYVVFTKTECGPASAVSNVTPGIPNYLLGDVTDGVTDCTGDDVVGTADVSLLGSHYGQTVTGAETWSCLDVGPTEDGTITARPLTDRVLQFEDLVIFGLTYGLPGASPMPASALPVAGGPEALSLDAPSSVAQDQTFEVAVRLAGAGIVHGLSVTLGWNAAVAQPVGVRAGASLESQGGLLLSPGSGRMDAVLLGAGRQGFAGAGDVAVWTFRARAAGDPGITLAAVDARDGANLPIPLGGSVEPAPASAITAFEGVSPNPFAGTATLLFSLASRSVVSLTVYSVDGRRVRTIAHRAFEAGRHRLAWDGVDSAGQRVRPGLYYARLEAGGAVFSRSMVIMR